MSNSNNEEKPIKIAVMGMENAGKTTMLNLLTQETDVVSKSPPSMNPTKGVERNPFDLFNKKAVVWDFGGQEIYRDEYFNNPDKYFYTISLFYYVIDVQDYYRLVPSVMYFSGVFNLIKKYSPDTKMIFLFHKMDPGFDPNERNLKQKFLDKTEPGLKSENISYKMYDTTIFNLSSIKSAFNQEL